MAVALKKWKEDEEEKLMLWLYCIDRIHGRHPTSIEGVHRESRLATHRHRFHAYDEHFERLLTDFAHSFSSIGVTA